MRILVDARLLHEEVGIGRYLREIVSRWLRRDEVSLVRLLGDAEALESWLAERDGGSTSDVVPWTDPVYSARAQLRWPLRLSRQACSMDAVFFPHYDVPLVRHPVPSVVTVHDLTHVRMPEAFPAPKRLVAPVLLDGALRRARRVVAVSERTRDDILDRLPELEGRVRVVPNGVGEHFRPLAGNEREEGRWSRYQPYLLAVATPRPHKNLGLAVEVLARLRESGRDLRLVIVGPADPRAEEVLRRARGRGVEEHVALAGRVDDAALRRAYTAASLLLFPSLYEGFGLPPLEAMACGTPVLASPVGALPDVLGGVAPLLDPRDPEAWTREALRMLDDGAERARRIEKGLRRAKEYSWERAADETLAVLRSAAKEEYRASRERT